MLKWPSVSSKKCITFSTSHSSTLVSLLVSLFLSLLLSLLFLLWQYFGCTLTRLLKYVGRTVVVLGQELDNTLEMLLHFFYMTVKLLPPTGKHFCSPSVKHSYIRNIVLQLYVTSRTTWALLIIWVK